MRSVAEIETIYIGDWKSLCAWLDAMFARRRDDWDGDEGTPASSVEARGMPSAWHQVLAPLTPDAFCGWMEAA